MLSLLLPDLDQLQHAVLQQQLHVPVHSGRQRCGGGGRRRRPWVGAIAAVHDPLEEPVGCLLLLRGVVC